MGQLFFRKQFFASIHDGSKTSTIRRWNRPIVTAGRDAFAPNVGWLSVLEVSQVELPELGESDAQTDGFENHAAMIKTLAELYPDQQTDGKKWYRIRFVLKEPAKRRGKRAKAANATAEPFLAPTQIQIIASVAPGVSSRQTIPLTGKEPPLLQSDNSSPRRIARRSSARTSRGATGGRIRANVDNVPMRHGRSTDEKLLNANTSRSSRTVPSTSRQMTLTLTEYLKDRCPDQARSSESHQSAASDAPPETEALNSRVLTGDSLAVLPTLPAGSAQCCITSPPYWGLRDYDHPAQIGAEPSPEDYIRNLVSIFREVRRVLNDDGTLWLNVGDGYARNGGTGKCGPNAIVGNTKKMIQKRNCKVPPVWGLKNMDLMGLPWRVAFALQADGWYLRSKITWIKKTAMPESVKNRPTSATEDIFMFAKSEKYFYNPNGVREESGANLRNYWILGPDISGKGHPATFPRELARRCILLGSREGDTILDPFGGSGTTGVAAKELGRRSILVELNPEYAEMGRDRVTNGRKKRVEAADSGILFSEYWQNT